MCLYVIECTHACDRVYVCDRVNVCDRECMSERGRPLLILNPFPPGNNPFPPGAITSNHHVQGSYWRVQKFVPGTSPNRCVSPKRGRHVCGRVYVCDLACGCMNGDGTFSSRIEDQIDHSRSLSVHLARVSKTKLDNLISLPNWCQINF